MAKPNGLARARLGVVVGKRVAKQANARNYMKRVVRECFRRGQHEMAGLDMIARVHKPFVKDNFVEVSAELRSLFLGVKKCLARSSS
jgi:ribonuclease P protein component